MQITVIQVLEGYKNVDYHIDLTIAHGQAMLLNQKADRERHACNGAR